MVPSGELSQHCFLRVAAIHALSSAWCISATQPHFAVPPTCLCAGGWKHLCRCSCLLGLVECMRNCIYQGFGEKVRFAAG